MPKIRIIPDQFFFNEIIGFNSVFSEGLDLYPKFFMVSIWIRTLEKDLTRIRTWIYNIRIRSPAAAAVIHRENWFPQKCVRSLIHFLSYRYIPRRRIAYLDSI